MNDFFLYEQLCTLEAIGKQYSAGRDYSARVRSIADQLASQVYRVAVVGEFKKGKSSLINALLGSSILPTDILPMTAAINRVIYGEKERIVVQYKDGRSEDRSVAELLDFGTKIDAQKEGVARTIREIQVYYPSVFCKNHIEVLDTPGLNDNEEMTAVTLSILGEVDAAIFVVSALEPLSMTEQDLILTLIAQPGIRHIIFVVTCIDAVSPDPEQQDRVVNLIRERICENALNAALDRFDGEEKLLEKAKSILRSPDISGVSSLLAMKGFVRDDEDLLEDSRFPVFKNKLLAYLTAAQSTDTVAKTVDAAKEALVSLDGWYMFQKKELSKQVFYLNFSLPSHRNYVAYGRDELTQLFKRTDQALERRGLSSQEGLSGAQAEARKPFIVRLSRLRVQSTSSEDVLRALQEGKEAAENALAEACRSLEGWAREETDQAETEFGRMRKEAGFMPSPFQARMERWREQTPFPQFQWVEDPIPSGDLLRMDVMPQVNRAIKASLDRLGGEAADYMASWRVALMRQLAEDCADEALQPAMAEELNRCQSALSALEVDYDRHRQQLREIWAKLDRKD